MKPPKPGQIVYVKWLTLEDRSTKPREVPRAGVKPLEFDHSIANYLGKLGERWALKTPGKPKDYCVAWNPEKVFATAESAQAALDVEIDALVAKLTALKGGSK